MNKTKISLLALLAAMSSLNIGCMSTVTSAYDKAKDTLSGNSAPKPVALYAQVPDADKERITALNHELEITKEEERLAQLEEARDNLKQERSEYNSDRLKYMSQEKAYRIHLAKLEAVDRNQLGDKITNIESITDTHLDAIKVQQKRLKLDSKVSILDVQIDKLEQEITGQKNKINTLANVE